MKNKKIILEIILIPICLWYLLNKFLTPYPKVSLIILIITLFLTSLEFIIKNFKEVYIYESKNNIFKVTFAIFNIFLLLLMTLNLIYKKEQIKILFIASIILLLMYLLYYGISSIINIAKNKKTLYKYIIRSFFSLISFVTILQALIIFLN